jgi:hypothetical protein
MPVHYDNPSKLFWPLLTVGAIMNLPEPHIHSFIIKIWLEQTGEEFGEAKWRGHITHVPSGERKLISDLKQIPPFIVPYIKAMGVRPRTCWRLSNWLDRWIPN